MKKSRKRARGPAPEAVAAAAGDDDEWMLPMNDDKPGFVRWVEALAPRPLGRRPSSSVGRWLGSEQMVEVFQPRGKRISSMGHPRGNSRLLWPEEALYLLDNGDLLLKVPPPKRVSANAVAAPAGDGSGSAAASSSDNAALTAGGDCTETSALPPSAAVAAADVAAAQAPPAAPTPTTAASPPAGPAGEAGAVAGGDSNSTSVPDAGATPAHIAEPPLSGLYQAPAAVPAPDPALAPASLPVPAPAPVPATTFTGAAVPASPDYLSMEDAFSFLISRMNFGWYLTYSQLKDANLVVLRHQPLALPPNAVPMLSVVPVAPVPSPVPVDTDISIAHDGPSSAAAAATAAPAPTAASSALRAPPLMDQLGMISATARVHTELADFGRSLLPMATETPLVPVFDVFARDEITSFKPSAPGPPDAYVVVVKGDDPPPTAFQIADLQRRLAAHSESRRLSQVARLGKRADLDLRPPAPAIKFAVISGAATVTFFSASPVHLGPPTAASSKVV